MPSALDTAINAIKAYEPRGKVCADALRRAVELAASEAPSVQVVERLGAGWVAEEALAIAVYCALVADDFRSGVLLAVNHSGDSDSTGSICGQILGAIHGPESIPDEWVGRLNLRDVIERVAADLYRSFHEGHAGNTATEIVNVLLSPFREIEVGREVAEPAGRLRRESGIRLPDALIAATAVEHKLSLFTRNRADFEGVRGLRIREIG